MRRIGAALLGVVIASAMGSVTARNAALAALPPTAETAVESYAKELRSVETAKSRVSLERLFLLAYGMRGVLVSAAEGQPSAIEELTDDEFASLGGRLRGLVVNRDDTVFAVPDAKFFEQLGERKGRTEDRLLLRLYHRTYDSSVWPVYVRQQTDHSGCTDFGPGKMTKLYGEWSHYRTLHPDKYARVVEGEVEKIVEALTKSRCACGPSGSVQSELRYFVHRHPGSPIIPSVRARLNELLHGEGNIRFNCTSG